MDTTSTDAVIAAAQAYWAANSQKRYGLVWDTLSAKDQATDSRQAFVARYEAMPNAPVLLDFGEVVSATIAGTTAQAFTSSKAPTRADIRRVITQPNLGRRSAALDALPKVSQPHTIRLVRQAEGWRVRLWLTDAEDNARYQRGLRRLEFQLVASAADPPRTWLATDINNRKLVLERTFFLQPTRWLASSVERTATTSELKLRLAVDAENFLFTKMGLRRAIAADREVAVVLDGIVVARVNVAKAHRGAMLHIPLPQGFDTATLSHVVETKDLIRL